MIIPSFILTYVVLGVVSEGIFWAFKGFLYNPFYFANPIPRILLVGSVIVGLLLWGWLEQ